MLLTNEQRRERVYSTDVAAILGVNPYCTAEQVRLEKLGRIEPFDGNESTEFGQLLEEPIAKRAASELGVKIRKHNHPIYKKNYPWLGAHIDRDIVGKRELLEIKTTSWFNSKNWGEQNTDDVPLWILPQVHTQLLLLDYERAHVACYFGGSDLRFYIVERSPAMDEIIINKTKYFWEKYVLQDIPAPVDWSTTGSQVLLDKLYKGTNGTFKRFDLDHPANGWRDQIDGLSSQIKALTDRRDAYQRQLENAIGSSSGAVFADGSGYERKLVYRKAFTVAATQYYKITESPRLKTKLEIWGL